MATASALQEAEQLLFKDCVNEAIDLLNNIVRDEKTTEQSVKVKEMAVLKLGATFAKHKMEEDLGSLIVYVRGMISIFTKAKAAKLVRELVDLFLTVGSTAENEVSLCQQCIDWATKENRVYLRQSLQSRLISVHVEKKMYPSAVTLASSLLKELKKIDDKSLLVEVQLLESRAYQSLGNINRARASLTSAKTTANGIYCPPKLQASLDIQSGILHAEEKDYRTAFSYFYEAFENYDSIDHPAAVLALKYMLLCKIMLKQPEDVQSIVTGKLALRYAGPQTVAEHTQHVAEDPIVKSHLASLYDTLLEQNLLRIIEPFSRVEVDHVAMLINLPQDEVEKKLSQMILDKSLHGILDQGKGVLILFEDASVDETFVSALNTIGQLGNVVDSLYKKAKHIQ